MPILLIYNILLIFLFFPLLFFLLLRGKKERIKSLLFFKIPTSSPPTFLLHAVSLGESVAAVPIADILIKEGKNILFSTTTETGQHFAKKFFEKVYYFPQDFLWNVHYLLSKTKPEAILLMEREIWPNLLHLSKKKNIPIFLLNARLSDASFKRYKLLRGFFTYIMNCFTLILCQSEDEKRKFNFFTKKTIVVGNTKFDTVKKMDVDERLKEFLSKRKTLLCGSTHKGEEEILLDAFLLIKEELKDALLIICPRHIHRVSEIESLIKKRGLSFRLRSRGVFDDTDVLLIDTIGELSSLYALADIAFVGGSLVNIGGHSIIEPLFFGKPILFGPYMQNFSSIADTLIKRGIAQKVKDSKEIKEVVLHLLKDVEKRKKIKEEAEKVFSENKGAAERMVKAILQRC